MLEIMIRVDTNDGDYAEVTNIITEAQLKILRPVFKAIKNFKPYKVDRWKHDNNFPSGECLREDLGEKTPEEIYDLDEDTMDLLCEFLPSAVYGFHTIERVEIFPQSQKKRLV